MGKIYTITVLHSKKTRRRRTWGWFGDYEAARRCIMENRGDIYECGFYNLVVIEELPEGTIISADKQDWFSVEYDFDDGGTYIVVPIHKPLKFAKEHLIAF
jgi:hypothetical protein